MKLAITTSGYDIDASIDQRFGRAVGFLIYDTESKQIQFVDNNQNLNATQGAGIQAARNVINTGAQAVITGHTGPKAFQVLKTASITLYHTEAQTVNEAIGLFSTGKLSPVLDSDVEEHWV